MPRNTAKKPTRKLKYNCKKYSKTPKRQESRNKGNKTDGKTKNQ